MPHPQEANLGGTDHEDEDEDASVALVHATLVLLATSFYD